MTPAAAALDALTAAADPARAADMAAYHKARRTYLGVPNGVIDGFVQDWRTGSDVAHRVALAAALWDSDVHEGRVAAGKLLTQARIRPDDAVWDELLRWVPGLDAWAIADQAAAALSRRIEADPARLDVVEHWTRDPVMWVRRAALVATLSWAKLHHAEGADLERRERILGWAAGYADDRDWFIQKAIAWWLRTLSKRDPGRVAAFLDVHGSRMKAFARGEAAKYLGVHAGPAPVHGA